MSKEKNTELKTTKKKKKKTLCEITPLFFFLKIHGNFYEIKKPESLESNDRLHLEGAEHQNIKTFKNNKELLSFYLLVSTESNNKLAGTGLELTITVTIGQ